MSTNSEPAISKTLNKSKANPQSSPNKKPKTENSPTPHKGKCKIEDETSYINCCGICLSEQAKSIRGYIDSCDHYFCFVCIMEWAKVESLCPMCKRRFSTIRRPVKDGVFASERIVNVPVRDQVYRHYENVTPGTQDPYTEIRCNVCNNNSNGSLLLLCDLCDSASHTYCVGLGDTVPEDDWICRHCTLLMYEHAEDDKDLDADGLSATDPNSGNQNRLQNHQNVPSAEAPVSILDIVRESSSYDVERTSSNRSRSPSAHVLYDGINIAAAANVEQNSQAECHVGHGRSQFGARTVQHCRSVDSRIRALRENWDKIRKGSMSFSSFPISKPGSGEVLKGTSVQQNSSSCSNNLPSNVTQDVDKAWKRMKAAMSIEKKKCTSSNVPCSSNDIKRPLRNMNTREESASVRSMVLSSCNVGDKDHDRIKLKNHYRDCAAEKHNDKRNFHMSEREKSNLVPNLERYRDTSSIDSSKSTLKMAQYSVRVGTYQGNCVKTPQRNSLGTFSNNSSKTHGASACRSTRAVSKNCYIAKQDVDESSACILDELTKARIESDAKSEIQSLVKLNMKVLSKNKKLDTNSFKEVARLATHSILAACAIGQPKPWVRTFQSPICSHADKVEQVRMSTLMPGSCRECFFVFVKDVVSTILLEKTS